MALNKKIAIAIGYKDGEVAPKILAKGVGIVAEMITKKAIDNDIYINEDEGLSNLLNQVPIGSFIPEETYEAMAEVLAVLQALDKKKGAQDVKNNNNRNDVD